MAQRYTSENDDRSLMEQDELARQLRGANPSAPSATPTRPTSPSAAPSASPEYGTLPLSTPDPSVFTAGYTQRGASGGGAGRGALSGAGTGATVGSMIPGVGTAVGAGVGALVGGIKGAFDKHAASAATDYSVDDARKILTDAYTAYNGHPPSEGEIDTAIRGQGWQPGDRWVGSGSIDYVTKAFRDNAQKAAAAQPSQPATAEQPAGAQDFRTPGQFLASSRSYDREKLTRPWDEMSEKYQIGTVLSHFDPKQGITPEVIAALNAANIHGAQFSGSGQNLNVNNAGKWERFGEGGSDDIVQNFSTGNGVWGSWTDPVIQAQRIAAQRGGGGVGAAAGPSSTEHINSLVPTDTNFYNQLQAKLAEILGGNEAFDREALLSQLTGGR